MKEVSSFPVGCENRPPLLGHVYGRVSVNVITKIKFWLLIQIRAKRKKLSAKRKKLSAKRSDFFLGFCSEG